VAGFVTDVVPHVERQYRVRTESGNTAIAGLSMGGLQTLQIATEHLDRHGFIGVFSSGLFRPPPNTARGTGSGVPRPAIAADEWEHRYSARLDDAELKCGLRLLWFATGKDDFLLSTTQTTVALFKRHGFSPVFVESTGGHTWLNWRNYLADFAPQLFRADTK
jgi:enterochelin esterase-like enzyme